MKRSKHITWAARILSIALVVFISIFAFDVFEGDFSWWMLLAFVLHVLPALVLLVVTIMAWRCDWVGALGFLLFAGWYSWQSKEMWTWGLIITVPALIISFLYYRTWIIKKSPKGPAC